VARPQGVLIAERHRVEPQRLGDPLHVHFDGELRLRRAESAERAVRRRVGEHGSTIDAHVLAAVWASGVNAAAGEHHGTERDVCTAIEHDLDIHRDESPIARESVRCLTTEGCRLVVASMSSTRSYTIFTGRFTLCARTAAC